MASDELNFDAKKDIISYNKLGDQVDLGGIQCSR